MARPESTEKWLARLRFIQGEYAFTDGEVIELRDEDGRLHAVDEPACRSKSSISFWQEGRRHGIAADIWGSILYYYRDVRVPSKFVLRPEEVTFEEVMHHPNTEVRCVGVELYGFQRMVDEGRMKLVSENKKNGNQLFHCNIGDEEALAIISVWDGTPDPNTGKREQYFLKVPPDIKDVDKAVAWTFYMEKGQYKPCVET